jgi:hypothetical protein
MVSFWRKIQLPISFVNQVLRIIIIKKVATSSSFSLDLFTPELAALYQTITGASQPFVSPDGSLTIVPPYPSGNMQFKL